MVFAVCATPEAKPPFGLTYDLEIPPTVMAP